MARALRVRFEKGVFKPLERVEFTEGEELEVIVVRKSFRGFHEEAGKYRFVVDRDVVEEFNEERK